MRWLFILILLTGCTGSAVLDITPMGLKSPAFKWDGMIPEKFTCDGEDVSPPLLLDSIPKHTKSLAITIEDPDTPKGWFTHWKIWNIPVTNKIEQNKVPEGAIQGKNDFGTNNYRGPCPPNGETHQYRIKVFALDKKLDIDSSGKEFDKAIDGHVLAEAELVGRYKRT